MAAIGRPPEKKCWSVCLTSRSTGDDDHSSTSLVRRDGSMDSVAKKIFFLFIWFLLLWPREPTTHTHTKKGSWQRCFPAELHLMKFSYSAEADTCRWPGDFFLLRRSVWRFLGVKCETEQVVVLTHWFRFEFPRWGFPQNSVLGGSSMSYPPNSTLRVSVK